MRPYVPALLTAGLLATAPGALAQITITAANNLPDAGQSFTYNTAAYAAPPPGGNDVAFNFSGLVAAGATTIDWIDPADYSEPSMFPTAQMAMAHGGDTVFYAVTAEGLERVGERNTLTVLGNDLDLKIVHTNNMLELDLPLTSPGSWTDQVEGTVDSDGSMGSRSGFIQGNVDAYGYIDLPGGITSAVLRVYTRIDEVVQIAINGNPANVAHKRHQYDYYVPWLKMPVLTSYMDSMTYIFTLTESGIRFMTEAPVGVQEDAAEAAGFLVVPNPASDRIELVQKGAPVPARVQVIDAAGKVVLTRDLLAVAGQRPGLDVQMLAAGVYTVRLQEASGLTRAQRLTIAR
ncbi:MAG TPA: T9SS type A sorting domain-containing protein [Flavobacteriales bacterium]